MFPFAPGLNNTGDKNFLSKNSRSSECLDSIEERKTSGNNGPNESEVLGKISILVPFSRFLPLPGKVLPFACDLLLLASLSNYGSS